VEMIVGETRESAAGVVGDTWVTIRSVGGETCLKVVGRGVAPVGVDVEARQCQRRLTRINGGRVTRTVTLLRA
jgi:hypothetical protein